jgi:hypothetical protein
MISRKFLDIILNKGGKGDWEEQGYAWFGGIYRSTQNLWQS